MEDKKITIWCENIFSVYSAEPLCRRYNSRGFKVYLCTYAGFIPLAKKYLGQDVTEFYSIESIDNVFLRCLHYFFMLFFISPDFSEMYKRVRYSSNKIFVFISKYLNIPLRKETQNRIYHNFFSQLNFCKLPSKKIISFTLNNRPYLLCKKRIKHISIMESWDHPVKMPFLIYPDKCLTWNMDLRDDININQHLRSVLIFRPLKFKYIYDFISFSETALFNQLRNKKYIDEIERLRGKKYILYPATTSSLNPFAHKGEMQLIDKLCRTAQKCGVELYIKPKPNGAWGDYDEFCKFDNVTIGLYATNHDSQDLLEQEYNIYRYLLLKQSYLVINVGTTFVLEAALAGIPVMQLILNEDCFDNFSVYSRNSHIEKYLHRDFCVNIDNNSTIDLGSESIDCFRAYSAELKKWVENEKSFCP